jgi:integrase
MEPLVKPNVIQFPIQEVQVGKIQCRSCHAWIDDDALFCCRCGSKVARAEKKAKYAPKTKHTKVPLKTQEEIEMWQNYLSTPKANTPARRRVAYRNFILFTLGISLGLRASDLVRLKVSDFKGDRLYIVEVKTGKGREIALDARVRDMVTRYANDLRLCDDNYLFWTSCGEEHLTPKSVTDKIMRPAAVALGLDPSRYGSHTLRKTFAYQYYKAANAISRERGYRALSVLCRELNHSSEAITLRYIGIDAEESAEILGLTVAQYNLMCPMLEEEDDE